jgi:hypothetical protein
MGVVSYNIAQPAFFGYTDEDGDMNYFDMHRVASCMVNKVADEGWGRNKTEPQYNVVVALAGALAPGAASHRLHRERDVQRFRRVLDTMLAGEV